MYGDYFIFNDVNSENYNIVIGSQSAIEDSSFSLNRTIIKGNVNKYREKVSSLGTTNDEVITFDFIILKNPCSSVETTFDIDETREILAWLTSPHYPTLFRWGRNDIGLLPYEYFGTFTEVTSFSKGGNIYGIKVKFETNSSYAYSPIISKIFNIINSADISIKNSSDNLNDYVYPIVKINPNFTGTLNITNVSDDNRDINIDVYQDNEITIDCAKLQIKDASGLVDMYDLGFTSLDYIYWIRLVNGENIFSITGGDVDITFEYRECYKIGIFN